MAGGGHLGEILHVGAKLFTEIFLFYCDNLSKFV